MNSKKILQGSTILSLVIALSFSQGCKKSFLDTASSSGTTSVQFWKTQADATSAINAMYADLHNWNDIAFAPIAIESMGSDDVTKGSVPTDASFMNEYHNFTVTAGEGQLDGFWGGMYANINFANQILDNVPGITMDDNPEKQGILPKPSSSALMITSGWFALSAISRCACIRQKSISDYNLGQVPTGTGMGPDRDRSD